MGDLNIHSVVKYQKKMKNVSSQCRKKLAKELKEGPFSLDRFRMLR